MSEFVMGAVSILEVFVTEYVEAGVVVEGIKLFPRLVAAVVVVLPLVLAALALEVTLVVSAGIKDEPDDCEGGAAGIKDDLPDEAEAAAAALEAPFIDTPFGFTSSSS